MNCIETVEPPNIVAVLWLVIVTVLCCNKIVYLNSSPANTCRPIDNLSHKPPFIVVIVKE